MAYTINEESKEKIISEFGNDFYIRVKDNLKYYMTKWHVDDLILIKSFSANLVFKGNSKTFGPIIMKFGRIDDEFKSEVSALYDLNSKVVCKLFDVDYDYMVLLEERVVPGVSLQEEKNLDVRLDEFCNLFMQLHSSVNDSKALGRAKDSNFKYKTYEEWVNNITEYMDKQDEWQEISLHMKRAKDYFVELSNNYKAKSLLHGDFHYYNILEDKSGYKIIDPKGVIGNPIFDIPRYMLNELWDEENDSMVDTTMNKVFTVISKKLDITVEVLSKLLYIEGAMGMCWNIQDGASIDEKEDILEMINWLFRETGSGLTNRQKEIY